MTTQDKIKVLEAERVELRQKIYKLRDKIDSLKECSELPTLKKELTGKCFKYNNGYSGTERWWMYVKVISVDSSQKCTVLSVETTTTDRTEIVKESMYGIMRNDGSYMPITAAEFNKQFKIHLKRLTP